MALSRIFYNSSSRSLVSVDALIEDLALDLEHSRFHIMSWLPDFRTSLHRRKAKDGK